MIRNAGDTEHRWTLVDVVEERDKIKLTRIEHNYVHLQSQPVD